MTKGLQLPKVFPANMMVIEGEKAALVNQIIDDLQTGTEKWIKMALFIEAG